MIKSRSMSETPKPKTVYWDVQKEGPNPFKGPE